MFKEPTNVPWLTVPLVKQRSRPRPLLMVGLGGISEGFLPPTLLYQQTGVLQLSRILLVDGKGFKDRNKSRQHFHLPQGKADDRKAVWQSVYPELPLYAISTFIDDANVSKYVRDRSIVLLAPDNHPTRTLLSDYAETVNNILLIIGGNDAISKDGGQDGTQGWVAVHCRCEGHNVTPPVTVYHPDLRTSGEKLPTEMSCVELAEAGQPQILATNLFVGQVMSQLLQRYLTQPLRQAVDVVEVGVNSATGESVLYGIRERHNGTLFSDEFA